MQSQETTEVLIDTKQAAALLGLSPITLTIWRCDREKDQPRFVRVGKKSIRYSPSELSRWVAARQVAPTAKRKPRG